MFLITLGLWSLLFSIAASAPATATAKKPHKQTTVPNITTTAYPLPNQGHIAAHDPNIIRQNHTFYLFKGGISIPISKSDSLSGPWEHAGTILDGPSSVRKENPKRPWAPTVAEWMGKLYCFYSISQNGKQNSAVGLAESQTGDVEGKWTDHGALINTGKGPGSKKYPFNVSNAIDPAFFVDPATGSPYLQYGSYWKGIFQLPLEDDLSLANFTRDQVDNLVYVPDKKQKPVEGSFVTYHEPWYYTWFSHGQCCQFKQRGFPKKGQEYSIRVGRSKSVHGPFHDRKGRSLLNGGGSVVYGSNHGKVYAPGGVGVLPGVGDEKDVLYYHYMNTSIGFGQGDARLGWNYLDYVDGWPVPR
ncbi:putative arabinan endo-1,5-alpha-L-arabinosidase D [Aspergillus unguis]